mgnify:FL=1
MARYLLSARNRVVWKRVMQMKMKKRIALLLAAAMLSLILCGCADDAETAGAVRSDGSVSDALATGLGVTVPEDETGRFASADGIHADVDYADMTWYIYDDAELLDKAARLGETADGKEAADLYDWLMAEYARVYTLDNLAYIDFYAHPDDETLSDACRQLDSVLNEVNDALCTALSDALDGPAGSALRSYIGEDKAAALVGYDEQTDRQREITERVSELTLQYNALIMEYLSYDEETEKIGALYRELVDLHNEEAQIVGYKDYADYAYEASYGRDFTPDDAAALCEAVKPYARQYFGSLYYNEATYADFSADTDLAERELVGLVTQYMPRVSDDAAKAAAYMEKHGLYFMDSAERVSDLGFTTTLDQYNAPFIYLALYGDQNDIQSMFHEFGHYYDAYVNPVPDLLLSVGSLDIFEIHSTGMEALSTGWYEDIYGEDADLARIRFLDSALYTVFSGCLFDEFQRVVYADPTLTPEQISQTFVTIARSYGLRSFGKEFSHYWMQVNHNFESPFYYISYAVSMLASLQIYEMAENDWAAAAGFYNDLVSLGAFDYTYCELLDKVGLECFTDGLPACVSQAVEDMEALCLAWENAA